MTSAKTLLRERKKIAASDDMIGHYYQDLQRGGKAFALAGKKRKAKDIFHQGIQTIRRVYLSHFRCGYNN